MQWIHNPSQINVDNLRNVRRDASRHFRNKRKQQLKAKFDELENNSKIKNMTDLYRGINDIKKGYKPGSNRAKDEKGDKKVNKTDCNNCRSIPLCHLRTKFYPTSCSQG